MSSPPPGNPFPVLVHADLSAFAATLDLIVNDPRRDRPVSVVMIEVSAPASTSPNGDNGGPKPTGIDVAEGVNGLTRNDDRRFVVNRMRFAVIRTRVAAPAEGEQLGRSLHEAAVAWIGEDATISTAVATSLGDDTGADLLSHVVSALDQARLVGPDAFVSFDDLNRDEL